MEGITEDSDASASRSLTFSTLPPRTPATPSTIARTPRSGNVDDSGHETAGFSKDEMPLINNGDETPYPQNTTTSKKRTAIGMVSSNAKKQKKRDRVPGGRAPSIKRIVADYDSEDQIIVDMKRSNYTDAQVVERLVKDGRTRYDHKSINSRWQRIRRCLQDAEDELLDEELTDWHEDEDRMLFEGYAKAIRKRNMEIEKINQRFFRYVAQEVNKGATRPRFSARACKKRFEAKKAGTAREVPERDPDPEGRAREREERIRQYKIRKEQEAEAAKEDAAHKKKEQARQDKEKKVANQKRETEAAIRAQRKREEENSKKSKADLLDEKRKQKKAAIDNCRALRLYKTRKMHAEKMLLRRLVREANARERALSKYSLQFPLPKEAYGFGGATPIPRTPGNSAIKKSRSAGQGRNKALEGMDFYTQELELSKRAKDLASNPARGHLAAGATPNQGLGSQRSVGRKASAAGMKDIFGDDPRSMMTMAELYDLMRDRGMLLGRMKEVKGVVLSRLNEEDQNAPIDVMQAMLHDRGLPTGGSAKTLIRRLQEDDAKKSSAYKRRFARKLPAAEAAMARAATGRLRGMKSSVASGSSGKGSSSTSKRSAATAPGTPTPSRFSAKNTSLTPAPGAKRYNARQRTLALENAGLAAPVNGISAGAGGGAGAGSPGGTTGGSARSGGIGISRALSSGARNPASRTVGGRTPISRTTGGRTPASRITGGRSPISRSIGARTPAPRSTGGRTPVSRNVGARTPALRSSARSAGAVAPARNKGKGRADVMSGAQTPLASHAPDPTYAPYRMRERRPPPKTAPRSKVRIEEDPETDDEEAEETWQQQKHDNHMQNADADSDEEMHDSYDPTAGEWQEM